MYEHIKFYINRVMGPSVRCRLGLRMLESGLRLAHRSDTVSRAPEKMAYTTMAEPLDMSEWYLEAENENAPGIESMFHAK